MSTKLPQSENQVRFFFDQRGEINEQKDLMPWRLGKDGGLQENNLHPQLLELLPEG